MSEATRKLRSIEAHTTSVCGVRDLAADAIDAVEAQVAAQAKRHEWRKARGNKAGETR